MPGEVKYTDRELRTMQQEAIRRVQEMQRRSRQTVSRSGMQRRESGQRSSQQAIQGHSHPEPSHAYSSQTIHSQAQTAFPPPPSPAVSPGSSGQPSVGNPPANGSGGNQPGVSSPLFPFSLNRVIQMNNPISTLLETFHIDHDRLIILFVMLMVLGEGADTTLLLALVYLLL